MGLLPQKGLPQEDGQKNSESSKCGSLVAEVLDKSKDWISAARLLPRRLLHV